MKLSPRWKSFVASGLSGALFIGAPGLPCYQAAAQTMGAAVPGASQGAVAGQAGAGAVLGVPAIQLDGLPIGNLNSSPSLPGTNAMLSPQSSLQATPAQPGATLDPWAAGLSALLPSIIYVQPAWGTAARGLPQQGQEAPQGDAAYDGRPAFTTLTRVHASVAAESRPNPAPNALRRFLNTAFDGMGRQVANDLGIGTSYRQPGRTSGLRPSWRAGTAGVALSAAAAALLPAPAAAAAQAEPPASARLALKIPKTSRLASWILPVALGVLTVGAFAAAPLLLGGAGVSVGAAAVAPVLLASASTSSGFNLGLFLAFLFLGVITDRSLGISLLMAFLAGLGLWFLSLIILLATNPEKKKR